MADLGVFQPLFPEERVLGPLQERAAALIADCHGLSGQAGTSLAAAVRPLLRAMNSYYTNKIEGQHTRPADIERALAAQFDADAGQARKQRLALAHMDAEAELEPKAAEGLPATLYERSWVAEIHRALHLRLPAEDCVTDEGEPIVPGVFRHRDVMAGRHAAPHFEDVEGLLDGWGARYRALAGAELRLVGAACAHHRLLWIHPFIDGNGRTARLHSHLMLRALGLTHGLWSPMRGLARNREAYYARLNNADLPRRNDLDGRGPLSQEELVAFAEFFLDVCLDQVRFMAGMLDLTGVRDRLKDLLAYLAEHPWQMGSEKSLVKPDALEALHYTAMVGEVERARFIAMTGLPGRTGRRMLASLIDAGLLRTASSRAPVAFSVPMSSLRFLFPRLWPEAEADA